MNDPKKQDKKEATDFGLAPTFTIRFNNAPTKDFSINLPE